jgi:predicted N-formylglutamate amidohydrolase
MRRLEDEMAKVLGDDWAASWDEGLPEWNEIPGEVNLRWILRLRNLALAFDAVRGLIAAKTAPGRTPVFVAIHSFTPRQHGVVRPWHIGVLWDKDPRLPLALLERLRARRDIVVADNEPYSGRHPADYTIDHHAEPLGLAHASVEIRQDLIRDDVGQARWAERLGDVLAGVLEVSELYDPARSWLEAAK